MQKSTGVSSYRRFLQGDNAALEETVRLYSDALVRFAYCYVKDSATAEDIMEDAFVVLIMKRKDFVAEEQLRAYLYKVVRSKCLDHIRVHKRQVPLSDFANTLVGGNAEHTVLQRERERAVHNALSRLPVQYKEVLQLAYFGGYGTEALCEALGKTKKQAYNLLARAKTALGKLLEKEGISHENL